MPEVWICTECCGIIQPKRDAWTAWGWDGQVSCYHARCRVTELKRFHVEAEQKKQRRRTRWRRLWGALVGVEHYLLTRRP